MGKALDLTGQTFGRLTALCRSGGPPKKTYWWCRCVCGERTRVRTDHLRAGRIVSCGCFGLTGGGHTTWTPEMRAQAAEWGRLGAPYGILGAGRVGELHGHTAGGSQTPEYACWAQMKYRCTNPSSGAYADYGGRGITVCDRWMRSFAAFLADMGEKPEPKRQYSLDRIDNDGHYEPGNCRWATWKQQANNQRRRRAA